MMKPVWLLLTCLLLAFASDTGQAAVTYSIGLGDLVGKSSANTSLLGYEVRIGKFATGFTASASNYDQWLSNFTLLPPSTHTLINDADAFVEPGAGDFGPFVTTVEAFTIETNVPGFVGGDQLYIWISNSTSSGAGTQVALFTDSPWQYSTATSGGQPGVQLVLAEADPTMIVGTLFDDSYVDGGGEPGIRLVTQNINSVPEPTQSLLVFVGLMTLVARRRRRNMI